MVPAASPIEEAAFWVRYASAAERRAYALACFEAMPARDRDEFLDFARRRAAA